jgi:hypothetical protein
MTKITDELYEKLQKLLRKAESARELGSLAEAEAFAMKAQAILMEYNMAMEDVDLEDKPKVEGPHITDKDFLPKNEGRWLVLLYQVIARYNMCRAVTHNHGADGITLCGEKINIETVRYICDQLEAKLRVCVKDEFRRYAGPEKKGAYTRGFYLGAVEGIRAKLESNKTEMQNDNRNITALIVVKDAAVVQFMQNEFGRMGRSKGAKTSSADGRSTGYKTGQGMSINKGVGYKNAGNLLN